MPAMAPPKPAMPMLLPIEAPMAAPARSAQALATVTRTGRDRRRARFARRANRARAEGNAHPRLWKALSPVPRTTRWPILAAFPLLPMID